jgi:general secretion pathway protein A
MPDSSKPAQPVTACEQFHGLTAPPFSLTPDLRFVYHSRSHLRALEQVTSALRRREGLIVVTGEIGTGKTMLCRTLLETFSEERTFLSVILDPGLTASDLLRQILADFGLIPPEQHRAPVTEVTRHQLVATLQQFLASLIPLNAHAVIMLDEAQHLSPGVLEEIRLLSNFETDQAKLLQIVLVGQPNLDEVLGHPEMRQLNQRIARRCELQPLSNTEVQDYIDRRLYVAARAAGPGAEAPPDGAGEAPLVEFSAPAIRVIAGLSKGIPRVVNTLCDRSLEIAFERDTHAIDPGIVREAARRLKLPGAGLVLPRGVTRARAAAAAVALAAALGLYWWWQPASRRPGGPAPADAAAAPAPAADRAEPPVASPSGTAGAAAQHSPAATPAAAPPPGARDAGPAAEAPPAGDRSPAAYEIAVAAFRTERRAAEISAALAARGLPVSTRSAAGGAWYQVVVGPFATSADAEAAQRTLVREGFADTRVAPSATAERR